MHNILTVAQQEMTRLRARFKGWARFVLALGMVIAFVMFYISYQQGSMQGRSLYRIGLAPDAPSLDDPRFHTQVLDVAQAENLLDQGKLDVYITAGDVVHHNTQRAKFALGALELYLESAELARIADEYPEDTAFPLRVEFKSYPVSDSKSGDVVIPSLMTPTLPFAQVVQASLFLFPVFMLSVFFTSGLMNEKTDRRITILLSTPLTPFQVIMGKMLPYIIFTLLSLMGLTLVMGENPFMALLIFTPVTLFTFAIYLMVPLFYRTFKDTTFIAMFATTLITAFLVFPAVFTGINDFAYISPLSLAIHMFEGESFTVRAYLTSSASMVLIFIAATYVATRILNEEFLMEYRTIYRKLADAVYLVLNHERPAISVFLFSLLLIPVVYLVQLVVLAMATNLPARMIAGVVLAGSVLFEEIIKSAAIFTLLEHGDVEKPLKVMGYAFLSALGFLIGEKLLTFISVSVASQSMLGELLTNAGMLWIPLLAHTIFVTIVTLLMRWLGTRRYVIAIGVGTAVHLLYNLAVLGLLG